MKRLLSLLVTGSLLITPVLAAQTDVESSFPALREPAAFGDVADDIWYADAAELCYVTGLLNGTGNGSFSPSRSVTIGEAATLAGRIHHILSGGDGVLPEAPAEWGQLTLTRADGTSAGFHQNSETGFWLDEKSIQLCFNLDESWKAAEGQTVTLTLNGTDYTGTLTERGEGRFAFQLSDPTRDYENYTADLWDALWRPAPGNWSRNTAYYLETVLHTGPDQINGLGETATRLDFVKLLSLVSGDLLEPINDITHFPDATEETKNLVLPFYQAGILTGTDDYGTFRANGTLSRAEMATMAARLIRPERMRHERQLLMLERRHGGRAFAYAGTCLHCPEGTCTRPSGEACRHPELVRPSLEACGFDLGRTVSELFGFELLWSRNGLIPQYLTLVSGFFHNAGSVEWNTAGEVHG